MSEAQIPPWPGTPHVPQEQFYPLLRALAHWATTAEACRLWILNQGQDAPLQACRSCPEARLIHQWYEAISASYAASARFGPKITGEPRHFMGPIYAVSALCQFSLSAIEHGAMVLATGDPGAGASAAQYAAKAMMAIEWLRDRVAPSNNPNRYGE